MCSFQISNLTFLFFPKPFFLFLFQLCFLTFVEYRKLSSNHRQKCDRLSTELQFQSHRINKLVKDNIKLNKRNKMLKRDMSSSEEMQLSNAKRIRFYARLFQRIQKEDEEKQKLLMKNDALRVQKESTIEKERNERMKYGDQMMEHRYSEIDTSLNTLLNDDGSLLLSGVTVSHYIYTKIGSQSHKLVLFFN